MGEGLDVAWRVENGGMDAVLFAVLVVVSGVVGWAIRILTADRPILGDVFRFRGPGWPSGVQEDDDLQWRWRSAPAPPGPTTQRLRAHIGAGRPIDILRRRR